MVVLASFVTFLLAASSVVAAPTSPQALPKHSNPRSPINVANGVTTPYGTATGTQSTSGVVRFAVKYATAPRWQSPAAVSSWIQPSNSASALPPACPQTDLDPSQYSEDCLYLILYVPVAPVLAGNSVNTLVWIHGGSFDSGAATNPGLDGSNLALATGSIVATVQYRLGVLGFLPPTTLSGGINLGVKDVTQALTFLHAVLPSFGGAVDQITVAGQSSGAAMIRALLASPTAAALFKNGILHSDPIFYNFLPSSAYTALQTWYYGQLPCAATNTNCLKSLSLDTLLSNQDNLIGNASTISPAAGASEPLRPSVDGSFITTSLTGSSFPSTLKPLLITTVKDEGAAIIGQNFDSPLSQDWYEPIVDGTFGDSRTATLLASPWYSMNSLQAQSPANDQTRITIAGLGTDATWRCPNWTFARQYVGSGGSVHVGKFTVGATYDYNSDIAFCQGRVCHQDDIYITFGTTPSPSSAQSTLTTEIQTRWGNFMKTNTPNPTSSPYAFWNAATTTDIHALQFGNGGGEADTGACTTTFWGSAVQYDWQIYGVN